MRNNLPNRNQFYYRLGQLGTEAKETWKKMKADKSIGEEEKLVFMAEVINSKGKKEHVHRRAMVKDDVTDDTEGWVPWAKAAKYEGEECLLEQVERKMVESRRNVRLPPDTKVRRMP